MGSEIIKVIKQLFCGFIALLAYMFLITHSLHFPILLASL